MKIALNLEGEIVMKTNFRKLWCILLAVLLVVGISGFHVDVWAVENEATNLFVNGDFESQKTNWSTSGTCVAEAAHNGSYGLFNKICYSAELK